MTSRAEARAHIESFRERRGIAGNAVDIEGNINLRDLSQSLDILSEKLYGDLAHFIWELLQNADDCKYAADTTPRVDFILAHNSLTFQTNEIGFTKENVESLCAIGYSSKAGEDDTIGEKGIGFKSVFSIADVVSIRSGIYSFKLDIRPPLGNLGMVLPVWLDEPRNHSGTSINLQLKRGIDLAPLRSQFTSFDFSFLLFSRKIKTISLNVSLEQSFERVGKLRRLGQHSSVITTMINGSLTATMGYVTFDHVLRDMPPRQPGVQAQLHGPASTVLLAFPHNNHRPHLEPQKTYAFLPMDFFGFQFLIHADFVLIANRKDIHGEKPWNTRLQRGVSEALSHAFEWLATSSESRMQHSWPEYLNCLWSIRHSFLGPISNMTTATLRSKRLVQMELSNNTFRAPQDSLNATTEFRDTSGHLLITRGTHALKVMSTAYSANSSRVLAKLGVTAFRISDFVRQLEYYTTQEFASFSSNTSAWHSSVAQLLLRHFSTHSYQYRSMDRTALQALRIIPLNNGSWVSGDSSQADNIFLGENNRTALPAGLNFRFVQETAAADSYRRQLYEMLGARSCDVTEICTMIVRSHAAVGFDRPLNDLISHAVYLFRARYSPPFASPLCLRLVDSNLTSRYQATFHLPFGPLGSAIRRLFADDFNDIVWLHPQYENAVTTDEKQAWFNFLSSLHGVGIWPPLQSYGRLSGAMRHILLRNGSKEFLGHLKMRHQSGQVLSNLFPHEAETISIDIRNIDVLTDRGMRKLCETALPSLSSACLGLQPLLQLNDPNDGRWDFLGSFGVLTAISPGFYVRQIQSLKTSGNHRQAKEMAQGIYSALATYPGLTISELGSFLTENLIFVDPGRWLFPRECVWRASFPCTKLPVLSRIYRGCKNLFQTLLRVKDAGLDELILELPSVGMRSELERANLLRKDMLPALDAFLGKASPSVSQRISLLSVPIFPVIQCDPNNSASTTSFCRAQDKFWIADINWLKLKFEGLLPLLDVTGNLFTSRMDNIFRTFSMDDKRLSKSVQKEQIQGGIFSTPDPVLTGRLRRQSPYIIAIMSNSDNVSSRPERVEEKLSNIYVSRVQSITIRRFVLDGVVRKYGHDDQGEVHLVDREAELHINIRQGLETTDIIVPLTDRFAEYLNLGDAHRELLSKVLTTERVDQFIERLERAGVRIPLATAAVDEAQVRSDDDSDDATLAENPHESLESALRHLQISGTRDPSVSDTQFWGSQPQERLATPTTRRARIRDDTRIDSAISMRSRTTNSPISESELVAIASPRPALQSEPIEHLAARLSNATLSDRTSAVLPHGFTAPPLAEATRSGRSHAAVFGSGILSGFDFNSSALLSPLSRGDVAVTNPTRTTPSANRHIASDNSFAFHVHSDAPPASLGDVEIGLETPMRTVRRSHRRLYSGGAFRNTYDVNSFIAQEPPADTPGEIGSIGEHLVYKFLEEKLSPSFTYENWTSRNRNNFFSDHFGNGLRERDFADFTYFDIDGRLGQYLYENIPNFERATDQSNNTYHLEVKTTLAGLSTPARLSNNQISMAKKYSRRFPTLDTQNHVYILVRVYGLSEDPPRPQFCLFPDPWDLICDDLLHIEGDNGICVRPKSSETLRPAD